ncbi:hypothetical protein Q7P37_005610 [Cladosporium fusiforme]
MAANTSTSKDLPVELWMLVFEHVHLSVAEQINRHICYTGGEIEYCARRHIRLSYQLATKDAVDDACDTAAAVASLPLSEKESFRKTRAYYAINCNSRAAATQLRLSRRLFLSYGRPPFLTLGGSLAAIAKALPRQCTPSIPLVVQFIPEQGWERYRKLSQKQIYNFLTDCYGLHMRCGLGSYVGEYSAALEGVSQVKILAPPRHRLLFFGDPGEEPYSKLVLDTLKEAVESYRRDRGMPRIEIEVFV